MTNIFIESGSKTSNEYIFIKTVVKRYTGKEEDKDYTIVTVGGKNNLETYHQKFLDQKQSNEKQRCMHIYLLSKEPILRKNKLRIKVYGVLRILNTGICKLFI